MKEQISRPIEVISKKTENIFTVNGRKQKSFEQEWIKAGHSSNLAKMEEWWWVEEN